MPRPLVLVLLAIALAVSCTGDKEAESTPTREPFIDTTPQPAQPNNPELTAALLTPDDLGDGWQSQSVEGTTVAEQYYCGEKLASRRSDAFAFLTQDEQGLVLFHDIELTAGESEAKGVLEEQRRVHEECEDYISTDGVQRTEWHVDDFDSDVPLGDEATVETISTSSFGGPPARAIGVVVREDDALIVIGFFRVRGDAERDEALDIARLALEKFREHRD